MIVCVYIINCVRTYYAFFLFLSNIVLFQSLNRQTISTEQNTKYAIEHNSKLFPHVFISHIPLQTFITPSAWVHSLSTGTSAEVRTNTFGLQLVFQSFTASLYSFCQDSSKAFHNSRYRPPSPLVWPTHTFVVLSPTYGSSLKKSGENPVKFFKTSVKSPKSILITFSPTSCA